MKEIHIARIFRQNVRRVIEAEDELMHNGVFCLQLGNYLTELSSSRRFDTREHVDALNVVVELQNLAFATAKRSESSEILGHIERKDDPLEVFRWAVPRFDPGQNRSNFGHLQQVMTMNGSQLPALTPVRIRRFRHRRRCRSGRLVEAELIQWLIRKFGHYGYPNPCSLTSSLSRVSFQLLWCEVTCQSA